MTSRCRLAAALAGLALALAALGCREPRPVRVVLVTLDTVRLDCLLPPQPAAAAPGAAAEGGSGMPLLFARARSGALFERFYAATSITQPSHASMLTALHPWEHGVVSNGQVLPESVVTVPEVLREAGFATAAVVASFPVASRFGFGQGFDSFYEELTEDPVADRRWEGHDVPEDRFYSFADTVTDRALERLDELDGSAGGQAGRSQFLWLHYFDAHDPYGDTGEGPRHAVPRANTLIEQGKDVGPLLVEFRRAYDRDVAFVDRHLDRLLARLEADAGRFETHVVIASDHGESFGEGGALAHGMRLTEEQIRVPLVILSPRLPPGVRPDVAGSVDVARTLLALAGVAAGEPWTRARDLSGPMAGLGVRAAGALGMRRTFWTKNPTELRTDGTRHPLNEPLFYAVDRSGRVFRGNGRGLSESPPEASAETARGVEGLFGLFEERLAGGTAPAAADDETLDALRALGYVR